jgi:hypothetical protein
LYRVNPASRKIFSHVSSVLSLPSNTTIMHRSIKS